MRKSIYYLQLLAAILLVVSVILQPLSATAQGGRPEAGWSGSWHTRWTIMEYGTINTYEFDMVFAESGSQLTGTSTYYGWGFTGTVSGNNVTGRFSNSMNPQQHPHTFGPFQFTLSSAGNTFSGLYAGEYHYGQWDPRFTVTGTRTDSGTQPQPQPQPPYTPPYTPPYVPPPAPITPVPITPAPVTPAPITPTPIAPIPNQPAPSGCNFTGTWDSDFGDLQLTQTGNMLTGSYNYQEGKISGTVYGNTATGTWSESPSFKPPLDAGDFTFTLSSNCQSFSGQWRYGSCEWDGDIRGTRVGQPISPTPTPTPAPIPTPVVPAVGWTNTWDTGHNGLMTLTQSGNNVTGFYEHENGRITGTVSGNKLTGTWSEEPSHRPPDDAGDVEFTLAADGRTFTGRWRYGSSGGWYDGWDGKLPAGVTPSPVPNPNPVPNPQPANRDWNGAWDTDWGRMQISQSGTLAGGTYEQNNGRLEGKAGTVTLSGTWAKAPAYKEPKDAGSFEFNMSADGNTFTGNWRYATCPWDGSWNGTLKGSDINPTPGPNPNPNPSPDPNPAPAPGNNNPIVSFTITPQLPKTGETVVATGQASDPDGDALFYTWYLDGAQSLQYNNKQYFVWPNAPAGTHTLSLRVNDGKGGSGYFQSPVSVSQTPSPAPAPTPGSNRPPTAIISTAPLSPTNYDTVAATCQASDPDGDALTYAWSRDGISAAEANNSPYMTWQNPVVGLHTISIQVGDNRGGVTSAQQQVNVTRAYQPQPPQPNPDPAPAPAPTPGVNSPPRAYFVLNPAQPQAGNDIQVTGQSSDANGDALNYTWTRDGQALSQYAGRQQWKWTKAPEGGHVINLVVSDGKGGTDSYSKRIKIIGGSQPPDDTKKKWKVGPFSCFIATAAYGSETAAELDTLRGFRDQVLLKGQPGKWFVTAYYRLSPPLAEFIAGHEQARTFVRQGMLDPLVSILKQTQCLWDRANIAQ